MCLADKDRGGPRRCAGDTRNALHAAQRGIGDAQHEVDRLTAELADADRTYTDDDAYRAALNTRIRHQASATGLPHHEIARRFAVQQFLIRLSDSDPGQWIVTGGTALQYRSEEARPTRDADLAARMDTDDLIGHIEHATARRPGERGDFVITLKNAADHGSYRCGLTYILGGKRFAAAGLDITTHRQLPGHPDHITPTPVIDIDDSAPQAPIQVYPVANHLADKVGAMYQRYGRNQDSPSTRPHDLADVIILSRCADVDADELRAAIDSEARRRNTTIPNPLTLPNPAWRDTFTRKVGDASAAIGSADDALRAANQFLGPVLSGAVAGKRWSPHVQAWV
jgi:predicted nucleotidyltransferase component of viral defense system